MSGRIDLCVFFFRRTFRILPAYVCYIGIIAALSYIGVYKLGLNDFLPALTCTANYHNNDWLLAHLWSLCVEEQFYFLWPAAVAVLGFRRGFAVAASMMVVGPLVRVIYLLIPPTGSSVQFLFETNCDALATGCLLAGFRERLWKSTTFRRFMESRWVIAVPVVIVGAGALGGEYARTFTPTVFREMCLRLGVGFPTILKYCHQLFGITTINLCIAICIDWCVRFDNSIVGRVLNWAPVRWIGVISYSIYLWQQPFLKSYDSRPWTQYPLNLVCTLATAMLSYYLVERPMLHVRGRVEPWFRRTISRRVIVGRFAEYRSGAHS